MDRLSATLGLEDAVSRVRLVSPARANALAGMGIHTVRDLLTSFPRRYMDLSAVETVVSARIGQQCTIVGNIFDIKLKRPKPKLSLVEISLSDETGMLMITCFKQPWLMDKYQKGMRIAVAGELEFNYGYKRMTNPFIEALDAAGPKNAGRIIPVHPACEKISPALMRTIMANALAQYLPLYDPLPPEIRTRYRLMSRTSALSCIHFPAAMEEVQEAKRRLIYEELLFLETFLMHEAYVRDSAFTARSHCVTGPRISALRSTCPFRPTSDQEQAITEICEGMAAGRRMNHLLLGDVGTGKTLVAAFALAAVADTGTQAVLLAPTEILATQHEHTLSRLFEPVGIRHALLTGATKPEAREEILSRLVAGGIDVLIGTHAVLEPDVRFSDCSLVIIDEQQRFGVDQRAVLLERAPGADALYLTATPIPRTLALSLYGDLTLSYLRQRPVSGAGRKTHVVSWKDKGEAYAAATAALERGEQVYVVCPLVDAKAKAANGEGEAASPRAKASKGKSGTGAPHALFAETDDDYAYADVTIEDDADFPEMGPAAAVDRARVLAETVFSGYEVGLLHGKLASAEKQRVMDDFSAGKIDVLVATTVIEVGIDVPNATVMLIDSADRFGLSQLHQLRGRVGRGSKAGEVFLISSSTSKTALSRLSAMVSTDDGFELAQYDLSLRREGDILGNRQHGASVLKLVNVVRDGKIVEAAHADARAIIDADPMLVSPEHRALAREIRSMFSEADVKAGG